MKALTISTTYGCQFQVGTEDPTEQGEDLVSVRILPGASKGQVFYALRKIMAEIRRNHFEFDELLDRMAADEPDTSEWELPF